MMDLKYTYQQLNDQEAAFQTVQVKPQKVVFRLWELNANFAKQRPNDEMSVTKVQINWMKNNLRPEIETLDDLAEWCAMPTGEL